MSADDQIENDPDEEVPDEKVHELMESHDLDKETAEHVKEVMEEYDLDEDEAVELADEL